MWSLHVLFEFCPGLSDLLFSCVNVWNLSFYITSYIVAFFILLGRVVLLFFSVSVLPSVDNT